MNTPLSLVQELRGIRGGQKHNQADLEGLLSEIREARRQWQEQVDQAQHLLRELLGAVSELSGVQLPGIAIDAQKDGDGSLRLGFKTLKDRIRNELEGFASMSASEVTKQIQGRSEIVLDPLEKEMSARLDSLAEEFRGKLQTRLESEQNEVANQAKIQIEDLLHAKMEEFAQWIKLMTEGTVSSVPATVQRSLEPHIGEVKERLKSSFQQHLSMVVLELERTSQSKLEGIKKEMQSFMEGMPEQARQTYLASISDAMNDFNSHLATATQEATKRFESTAKENTDKSVGEFKAQLEQVSAATKNDVGSYADSQLEGFRQKLETRAVELQEKSSADIMSNVNKASQDALKSSLAEVQNRLNQELEHSKGELKSSMVSMLDDIQKQMNSVAQSARDSLSGEATRLSADLRNLGEEFKTAENQHISKLTETVSNLSRQMLEGHSRSLEQVAETHLDGIRRNLGELQAKMFTDYEAQLRQSTENQRKTMLEQVQRQADEASRSAVDKVKASSGQVVQELSGKVNKEVNTATTLLNQWAHQTTTWAESSIKESLESYKRQVGEFTDAMLEEQRTTIQQKIGDLQGRLAQAAQLLRVSEGGLTSPAPREKETQHA